MTVVKLAQWIAECGLAHDIFSYYWPIDTYDYVIINFKARCYSNIIFDKKQDVTKVFIFLQPNPEKLEQQVNECKKVHIEAKKRAKELQSGNATPTSRTGKTFITLALCSI